MHRNNVVNVVFAGLGGQGVIKASDILAEAAFRSGLDVKKSEIHGMSQRGGSVTSDVRYGPEVFSPMVPDGEAQFLVALESTQVTPARHVLSENGTVLVPELFMKEGQTLDDLDADESTPVNKRTLNVALIGMLSAYLDLAEEQWMAALYNNLPAKVHAMNKEVFAIGRQLGAERK